MPILLTNVFRRNAEAYRSGSPTIINSGGQGSSKTYSILQLLYLIARKGSKRITIVSYAFPHLHKGVMVDWERILTDFGENVAEIRTNAEYRVGSSLVEFFGVEGNIAIAHGPRRDILYVNEANRKITYEVFDQLASRSNDCVFMDFNPDQEFWVQEKILPNFPYTWIQSNFTDNPYLPERERQNILLKRDKPGFENWWRVYGLGLPGKIEGAIFQNWEYGEFDQSLPSGFGLDFGFNDPDAMVKESIDHKRKRIYLSEKIYKEGNSLEQLKGLIGFHATRNDMIIADSADARMISQLKRYFNIRGVNKAKWTIAEALKMMQDYEIIVEEGSENLAKELNNYIWNDKKAGVPCDGFNHLIDAARYFFQENARQKTPQRWTA